MHVSAVTAPRTYVDELRWVERICDAVGFDAVFVGTVDPTLESAESRLPTPCCRHPAADTLLPTPCCGG